MNFILSVIIFAAILFYTVFIIFIFVKRAKKGVGCCNKCGKTGKCISKNNKF
ncbi:MAG: hypothetical protein FWH10_00825 [Oscillospiraceae bacterium]|nr:hypothetical protein [Oscillospiraceae bacterium]